MTETQKHIIQLLLEDHSIAPSGSSGYRLRTPGGSPVMKINKRSFDRLRINSDLLRKSKSGVWVIDKRKVRKLHGRSFAKRQYKEILKSKKA